MQIFYLPIDKTSIPTGEILKVEDTPFDFREPHAVGERIDADHEQIKNGAGYESLLCATNKREPGELSLPQKSQIPRVEEPWKYIPPNQVYNSIVTTGQMATRDNMELRLADAAHSALKHNTSPIVQIIPISPALS